MKKIAILLSVGIAFCTTARAVIVYTASFDDTLDDTLTPPYVGLGTFSLSSAPADGFYTFSALSANSPSLSLSFSNGVSFGLADLVSDPNESGVYLYQGSFIFAANPNYYGPMNGTADFVVGGLGSNGAVFSAEQIWADYDGWELYSLLRGSAVRYPYYRMSINEVDYSDGVNVYRGAGGFDIAAMDEPVGAVPEPGTWAAAALLAGGATFMRWRRRRDEAQKAAA